MPAVPLDAAELNGPVRLGDLVVADDNGIAVLPADHIAAVLERCERATV